MIIHEPGHTYEFTELDGKTNFNLLKFVKREGPGYPGNKSHHPGTTTQEVLRALIDRIKYVDWQIHDWRNDMVLHCLRMAIFFLEDRAAERHGRRLPVHFDAFEGIEDIVTCVKCLHIGCKGECH